MKKKELDKLKKQMGYTEKKTIEVRGTFPRPVVFADKKKVANKNACKKQNVAKILRDY